MQVTNYVRSVLAATPASHLKVPEKTNGVKGIFHQQLERMEREFANLARELRLVEDTYGRDHLDLVLARGYVSKSIVNARVTRYHETYHPEFLPEFEKISEMEALASCLKRFGQFRLGRAMGSGPIEARGPQETPQGWADQVRQWG